MPAVDQTITTTQLVWYFTENQARNATANQIAGGEDFDVYGTWTFGAANQSIISRIFLDTATLENALTGAQAGDIIRVEELLPPHPEILNGKRFMVTATRTVVT